MGVPHHPLLNGKSTKLFLGKKFPKTTKKGVFVLNKAPPLNGKSPKIFANKNKKGHRG